MLYIEDICDPVPKFLKDHNFIIPKIGLYKDENLEIVFQKIQNRPEFTLYVNSKKRDRNRVMWYHPNHCMGYYYFSEYDLAYGNVLVTGLGMNMLPNWIATKPEVTKITVIENNEYLIDYIKEYGYIDDKIEIIHSDANSYLGSCDIYFCDHNFGESYSYDEKNIDFINNLLNNIDCNMVWNQRILSISNYNYYSYVNLRKLSPKLPDINKEKFELYKRSHLGYY
jgi:hypothetical protein